MGKNWGSVKQGDPKETAKYYVYEDGSSYWGLSLYRYGKLPIECTADIHKQTVEEKVKWYNENSNSKAE